MKPTLIILPGWAGNELLWSYQCQHLADICDTKVIAIQDCDTADKMADAVLAQVNGEFILLGHSLGGWIAQHIALKAKSRVTKLILVSTYTGALNADMQRLMQTNLHRIQDGETKTLLDEMRPLNVFPERRNDSALMRQIEISQSQFPESGMINQLKAVLTGGDTTLYLQNISCPTLIINGRQDAFFSVDHSKQLASNIPNANLVIIEECGHLPSIEQPQAMTALMRLWINAASIYAER